MKRLSTTDREAEVSLNASELSMLCNALRQITETLDESELQFLVGGTAEELLELANELDLAHSDMGMGPDDDYYDEDESEEDEEEE